MAHDAKTVSLTVVPMTMATISFISSSLIIAMMRRSEKKLKDAYRRIVFGMSLFDIFSSFAVMLLIFKSTPESVMWLPLGNQVSCNILGFFHIIGAIGTPMYSGSLNIYYYYLVRRGMREEVFKKKIEPWLHGVTCAWSIVGGIYIWAEKLINPSFYGGCFLSPYPQGCALRKDDDLECIRGHNHKLVIMLYMGFPVTLSVIVSVTLLLAIWWKIRSQEIRMDKYRLQGVSLSMRTSLNSISRTVDDAEDKDSTGSGNVFAKICRRVGNWRQQRQGRRRTASNSMNFMWAAIWYSLAFFVTFGSSYVVLLLYLKGLETPFIVKLLSKSLQPLQGLFNILIYTRPHVKTCRMDNPELTWLQAFRRVVTSGGDDDQDPDQRRSRRSRRASRMASSNTSSGSLSSRRSSMGGPRRLSMFGPIRRNSGRGDLFQSDFESKLEAVAKKACSSDQIERGSFNITNTEERSHTASGRGKSQQVSSNSESILSLDGSDCDVRVGIGANEKQEENTCVKETQECPSHNIASNKDVLQLNRHHRKSVTFSVEIDGFQAISS